MNYEEAVKMMKKKDEEAIKMLIEKGIIASKGQRKSKSKKRVIV